jgi:hypothetical protein
LQTSFIQNFNGTVVTQSTTSNERVVLCSRQEFLIPAATTKTIKSVNARFRVSDEEVVFEDVKNSAGGDSVSIIKLLKDCSIQTNRTVCNVDYTTDEIPLSVAVSMGLQQDAALSRERSVTLANPAHFFPAAPSCRTEYWAIFMPLSQETLESMVDQKSIKHERQNVEKDIILSLTSRFDLTIPEWGMLISIINDTGRILKQKMDDDTNSLYLSIGENIDEDIVDLLGAISTEIELFNSNLQVADVQEFGKNETLKMRVNDFFKRLNGLFSKIMNANPSLMPIIKSFKYDMFAIISEYSLNKNATIEHFVKKFTLRTSPYSSRKGGTASIVDPFEINRSVQFDKSSESSVGYNNEESFFSKKMERSDNFEESSEIESQPKIELDDKIKKIIESINSKIRSEIEMYAKMEKYKTLSFDKIKLRGERELSVAKYGCYEMIDENGISLIIPIKTEEQLTEIQEVEEYFKPLQSDTHIGGKGRRANRDAIKPKKTKKRASKAHTALKRVTKNKNKNKNNKSNKTKSKNKKNKKNHHNNRKKTRR